MSFTASHDFCRLLSLQNNLEKTDPSEIEKTYNIRKQQTRFIESDHEN